MRVIITGGTGLIGRALARSLSADGHEVILLSRSPGNAINLPPGVRAVYWDGRTAEGWGELVEDAGAVINLAGETIGGNGLLDVRWTPGRKRRILESRVNAGRAVTEAIRAAENKPGVLIQMSGVGYYGTHEDERQITESAPVGKDFLASVCIAWEDSTKAVERMGVRRVITRTAPALSRRGGPLPRQMIPFRFFVGGPIGSGRQWFPWIHLTDLVRAIRFLIDTEEAKGVFNVCAPEPVTNAEFSRALGKAMHRPLFLPLPAFAFKLAFGEAATVLLEGQRVIPARLQEMGFTFNFPTVESALKDLIG
ncbi:MAG: TIGR01777 family protein [Anaerolineae bacterium]|nr:TIGR01777 family protein [Anaerolineae bacterium]